MTLIHPLEAMSEGQRAAPETLWLRLLSLMKTVLLAYASSRIDLRLKSPLVNICFFFFVLFPHFIFMLCLFRARNRRLLKAWR